MTADAYWTELGRRAVACPRWRWMAGMLIADDGRGVRYCWADDAYLHGAAGEGGAWMRLRRDREHAPDLRDPATVGCLLALVREAHPGKRVVIMEGYGGFGVGYWLTTGNVQSLGGSGTTEPEALVAALEAAPGA